MAPKGATQVNPVQSLTERATPGPVLEVKPDDAVVQTGREVKIAIVDARIRASGADTFRLEYDPEILEFKELSDAKLLPRGETTDGNRVGTLMFQQDHPEQRSPRAMNLTFVGKASGVSLVRVELSSSDFVADAQATSRVTGSGVVRVR
jgi:general secretion pathway protein D